MFRASHTGARHETQWKPGWKGLGGVRGPVARLPPPTQTFCGGGREAPSTLSHVKTARPGSNLRVAAWRVKVCSVSAPLIPFWRATQACGPLTGGCRQSGSSSTPPLQQACHLVLKGPMSAVCKEGWLGHAGSCSQLTATSDEQLCSWWASASGGSRQRLRMVGQRARLRGGEGQSAQVAGAGSVWHHAMAPRLPPPALAMARRQPTLLCHEVTIPDIQKRYSKGWQCSGWR